MATKEPLPRIIKYIDVIAGIAGIFLGAFIISLYYARDLHQQDIGFVLLIASLIYLLLRNKLKKEAFGSLKVTQRKRLLLNIIFFVIYPITLLIWHQQLYCRPLSYFILISLLAGIIAIEIVYSKGGNPAWPILIKILLLSANIRAGIYYNFPSIMGSDAFEFAKIIPLIGNTGYVPPFEIMGKYLYYSIYHISVYITQVICHIDIKDALFCSIGLVSIISTVFIYLIGKKLAGPQIGLLATLLANLIPEITTRGIANINPGSLVLCYFLLLLYLTFKGEYKLTNTALIIFITLLAVISHQLSTFVVFISLTAIYLGKEVYKAIYKNRDTVGIKLPYILLFAVAMLGYWMGTYWAPKASIFSHFVGSLKSALIVAETGLEVVVTHAAYHSILANILFHFGYLVLLFFAIGGALLWLSSKDDKKFSIVVVVVILYLVVYGFTFAVSSRAMLPGRWFPFLSVFLVIIASAYIFKSMQLIKSTPNKIFAIFSIILLISFFMITTPEINGDNPIYSKERASRTMFKASEISAMTTINERYNGTIKVDPLFGILLSRQMTIRSTLDFFSAEYISNLNRRERKGTLLLLRRGSVAIGHKNLLLPKEFLDKFKTADYNLIYDNREVWAHISR